MKQSDNETMGFDRFEAKYPPQSWEKEIKRIIELTKAGNSSEIIGFPGVGRSNLLGLLAYNRATRELHLGKEQKNFHFVLMNFSEMRKKDETEVLKFFFISIIDSLKERSMDEEHQKVQSLLKESLEIPDKQVILQGLKKAVDYLSMEKNLTLVFLIDRFEEYIPYLTPEFFTNLRALRNRAKYRFSVVFSGNRSIVETLDPSIYVDYYEFLEGNTIYLPLKDDASLKFRIEFLQKNAGKSISPEKLKEILDLTSGHGKLTRLSIEAYLSENNETMEQLSNLSSFFLSKSKIKTLFLEIWKSLTPSEQQYLANSNQQLASSYLEDVHLLDNNKITIPLFEKYIQERKTELTEISGGKLALDPQTNEIKRGEVIISDSLTSSEFKLLKFLLQNEGKILERDEIVNAVWGDLSSTAGVTEQALDQLIFRVRKKIENNPNNPTHIQTVKGRGFKFTP